MYIRVKRKKIFRFIETFRARLASKFAKGLKLLFLKFQKMQNGSNKNTQNLTLISNPKSVHMNYYRWTFNF
jgi:hypothetical protein